MTELLLAGCRATPLGGYLTGLGVLRAVTRLLDPSATGRWEAQGFVLGSRFETVDELVDALHQHFQPEAIVSPWNAGSGFAANAKNVTAERQLQAVRESTDPRVAALQAAVEAGDRVVALGRERGWSGSGTDLWNSAHKTDVLLLCRNEFPDGALAWVDAVVALGQDADPAFSRLLGTGGNFGRQDLSVTYLARVASALENRRSTAWLRSALSGDESVSYLRGAVGQFDPGRAGGIQSSPLEKSDDTGFVNPWAFLLTVEGALLFATAVVRRHGAGHSRAALPFQVRGSTAGYGSAAPGESALAELWAPEWSRPARLDEVMHLLAEGRAEWKEAPARSGLDFARAVATLGVDRGIAAFTRHVFVDRLGQSPLAVPAGRIVVEERSGVRLLAALDGWLDSLRRTTLPAAVGLRLRALEQALFRHARSGSSDALAEVVAALGRCHEAVSRSGAAREWTRPLVLPNGSALLPLLAADADVEMRIAVAYATAHDRQAVPTLGGLRPLLSPVTPPAERARGLRWTPKPPPASLLTGLGIALAEAARYRSFPGDVEESEKELAPAVRGSRIAFTHGVWLTAGDVCALLDGTVDEQRVTDLLAGLLTVDWSAAPPPTMPGVAAPLPEPAVDLLLPFAGVTPLDLPSEDDGITKILLRPGSDWPSLLAAGRVRQVLIDAARRLRIAGVRHVVEPTATERDGRWLAAALLLTVPGRTRVAALGRVAVLPTSPRDEEIPA